MIKRVNKIGCAVAFTALTGLFMATQAQANLITNGSFETATGSGATVINGWTIGAGGVDRVSDPATWQASDGSWSIDLNAFLPGTLATTFATAVGAPILVTFDLSGNPGAPRDLKSLDVLVNGVVDSSFTYDTSTQLNTTTNMKYVTKSFTFTPTTTATTLTFVSTTNSGAGFPAAAQGPVLDNVVATAAVPEPGVVLLMGSGLLGLFGWRVKKQRNV